MGVLLCKLHIIKSVIIVTSNVSRAVNTVIRAAPCHSHCRQLPVFILCSVPGDITLRRRVPAVNNTVDGNNDVFVVLLFVVNIVAAPCR